MLRDLLKTDLELVEEVKTGNRRAFSELVRRHQKGLLRMSLRFVKDLDAAEDVVQESFIKAYEKLHSFEGRASFKSWLFQIAVNNARNRIRDLRKNMVDIENVQLAVGAEAESGMVHGAIAEVLREEVDKLPDRQRTALVLRVYEDLSFKEIAEIMGCPYDTAKANYRHALMKLREIFEEQQDLKSWTEEIGGFLGETNQYLEAEG
ncbi:MAG: RNA polymerase sigma factor [Pseudobdellovibrionaceae bacterium]